MPVFTEPQVCYKLSTGLMQVDKHSTAVDEHTILVKSVGTLEHLQALT